MLSTMSPMGRVPLGQSHGSVRTTSLNWQERDMADKLIANSLTYVLPLSIPVLSRTLFIHASI